MLNMHLHFAPLGFPLQLYLAGFRFFSIPYGFGGFSVISDVFIPYCFGAFAGFSDVFILYGFGGFSGFPG